MKIKDLRKLAVLPALVMVLLTSCEVEPDPGRITINFSHVSAGSGNPLVQDSLMYTNAAGNLYRVDELQYFISDVDLWSMGNRVEAGTGNRIHYVDIDIPSTLSWKPDQDIPAGIYDSVTFTFGINDEKNKSGLFVNPPERDMFWPEMMGGGYHYMKMNGKWLSPGDVLMPFNMHLGVGMTLDSLGNHVFVPNYFKVTVPMQGCSISGGKSNIFTLIMDINSWFETPNSWDWNLVGGQIMQNQAAMRKACENGADAFFIKFSDASR